MAYSDKARTSCADSSAIMLGIHSEKISPKAITYGLFVGIIVTLVFLLTPLPSKPFGFHAGVLGLGLNFLTLIVIHLREINRLGNR